MFDAPPEVRMAAGYLLVLSLGVVLYMRFAFSRAATDVSPRTSVVRVFVGACWGFTIAVYVNWPDALRYWNFFMLPQIRWFMAVPAGIGLLLMIWALRSRLAQDEVGGIIATGPYAWCRYPFDAALALFFFAVTLLCGNWLLVAIMLMLLSVHRLGVPYELERVRRARLGPDYDAYVGRTGWFLPSSSPVKKTQYQVPSRFGLTAIMGLLTVLAIIFGSLKAAEAPAIIYLFIGSEIVAICLVQILVGSAPRGGSTLIGAILLPLWVYATLDQPQVAAATGDVLLAAMIRLTLFLLLVSFGALMGYCIGTLAAGFFLMMDLLEPWLIRNTTAYQLSGHRDGGTDGD